MAKEYAVMGAKLAGCSTIVGIDAVSSKLDFAVEMGVTHVIDTKKEPEITRKLLEITNGRGFDLTFDTTGVDSLLDSAIESLRRGGSCGTVASTGDRIIGLRLLKLMGQSKRLVGIVQGDSIPWLFIPKLIQFYKEGRFPFDKLLKEYSLDDINKAAEDFHNGLVIKPVLRY